MHEATAALIAIVGLLILDMALTIATFASLSARIRDLHDEALAAGLARDDLDRRGRHRYGGYPLPGDQDGGAR